MKSFWLAIQFMSRLPTPQYEAVSDAEMGRAIHYFPLAGLLIGMFLLTTAQLSIWLPSELTAGMVLAIWVWITGALHLDGVADTADGWLGGLGDHKRALEIMKDSRIGTGGGVSLVLILLLKWIALTYVIEAQLWVLLVATPILARVASISLIPVTEYVSQNGIAEAMAIYLNRYFIIAWVIVSSCFLIWLEPLMLFLLAMSWFWMRWVMIKITGGMTGDTAGMMTEVIEVISLILATALLIQ